MKFTKLTVFAVLVAFLAISMWVTFQQDAFLTPVEARLLFIPTKPIPVIYYIATAFIVGLVIGVIIAINEHVSMAKRFKEMKRDFEAREKAYTAQLQDQISTAKKAPKSVEPDAEDVA